MTGNHNGAGRNQPDENPDVLLAAPPAVEYAGLLKEVGDLSFLAQ
jgi:hypothetical protein